MGDLHLIIALPSIRPTYYIYFNSSIENLPCASFHTMDKDQTKKTILPYHRAILSKEYQRTFKLLKHKLLLWNFPQIFKELISIRNDASVISKSNSELEIKRPESLWPSIPGLRMT